MKTKINSLRNVSYFIRDHMIGMPMQPPDDQPGWRILKIWFPAQTVGQVARALWARPQSESERLPCASCSMSCENGKEEEGNTRA